MQFTQLVPLMLQLLLVSAVHATPPPCVHETCGAGQAQTWLVGLVVSQTEFVPVAVVQSVQPVVVLQYIWLLSVVLGPVKGVVKGGVLYV